MSCIFFTPVIWKFRQKKLMSYENYDKLKFSTLPSPLIHFCKIEAQSQNFTQDMMVKYYGPKVTKWMNQSMLFFFKQCYLWHRLQSVYP